jgi:Rrf2 family protein
MAANSRLASAAQILCVMAYLKEDTTSQVIANSLRTNPVVVRRLLKSLEQAGLVVLRPGKDGGVSFARSPDEITLEQVHAAVEAGGDVFALRGGGNPHCPVNKTMPRLLKPVFASASQAVTAVLGQTTISSLARSVPSRSAS